MFCHPEKIPGLFKTVLSSLYLCAQVFMMDKCLWCTTALEAEGDVAIVGMLQRYSSGKLSEKEIESLNDDLNYCLECVVEYHRARDKDPNLHKVRK